MVRCVRLNLAIVIAIAMLVWIDPYPGGMNSVHYHSSAGGHGCHLGDECEGSLV